jgi:hypothetical protein
MVTSHGGCFGLYAAAVAASPLATRQSKKRKRGERREVSPFSTLSLSYFFFLPSKYQIQFLSLLSGRAAFVNLNHSRIPLFNSE